MHLTWKCTADSFDRSNLLVRIFRVDAIALCPALTAGTGRWAISRSPTHPDQHPGPHFAGRGCGTEERIAPLSISPRIGVEQTCSSYFRMGFKSQYPVVGQEVVLILPISMLDGLSCSCTSIFCTHAYLDAILLDRCDRHLASDGLRIRGLLPAWIRLGAISEPRRVSRRGGSHLN